MGIHGKIVLEDRVVWFEIETETQAGNYTVVDLLTEKSFQLKTASGRDICNMIALAVAWEGAPLTEEDISRLEALQSPDENLRVIP